MKRNTSGALANSSGWSKIKPAAHRNGQKGTIMNSVNLIGRLTSDPEIRNTKTQKGDKIAIATFTLAVARIGSEEADFIRCKVFGAGAEFAEKYLEKGQRIGVTGRIQTGRYEDDDEVTHFTTDVICDRITFADGKKAEEEEKPKKGGKRK